MQSKNKSARIVHKHGNNCSRTSTARRDDNDTYFEAVTDRRSNSTRLSIQSGDDVGFGMTLTGHQARTLYLLLYKHYLETGLSV
jgi:hypothetical protein